MALMTSEETPAPARPNSWKPAVFAVVVTLLVGATGGWLLASFQAKPAGTHSSAWLGTVTSAPSGTNGNTVCVRPLRGQPSGIVDGKPWCGTAYPSRGLQIGDVTVGTSVRVVTFTSTNKDDTDVSWVLVLPDDLPNPPAA
jgi:hypothetical protein